MHVPITVAVPNVWRQLLQLEDMQGRETVPSVWLTTGQGDQEVADHITDETPWLEDVREMRFIEGDYRVTVSLRSGQDNYYLNFMVEKSGTPRVLESFRRVDFSEDAEFALPCDLVIAIKGGTLICLHVDGARIERVI
jgi:hypothetical protein